MVSEPNFILGIKQISLQNKVDSHLHTANRSHTCLSAGSRLHGISQPPWLTAVSRSSRTSFPCLSLLDLCTSSLRLMKPTRQKCSTAYREQNPGSRPPTAAARATTRDQWLLELSHAPLKVLDSQLGSQTHALPRQPCRPPIYLVSEFGDHTTSHAPTRATWVSGFSSTRRWINHALATRRNL